jgi:hypothetical protein
MEEEKLSVHSRSYVIEYKLRKITTKYHLNVDIIDEDGSYPSKKDYYFDTIDKIERHENEPNSRGSMIVYFNTGITYKYNLYLKDADELFEFLTKEL